MGFWGGVLVGSIAGIIGLFVFGWALAWGSLLLGFIDLEGRSHTPKWYGRLWCRLGYHEPYPVFTRDPPEMETERHCWFCRKVLV